MSAAIVFAALTYMIVNWKEETPGDDWLAVIVAFVAIGCWFLSLFLALCGGGE